MASPWPPGTAEVFADRTSQTLLPMLVARADLGIFGLLTTAGAVGGLLGTSLHGWSTMRVSLGNIMRRTRSRDLHPPRAPLTRHLRVALAILFLSGAHAFIWGTTSHAVRQ